MSSPSSLIAAAAIVIATAARADLSISNKPTHDVTCNAGVCTATAQKAVLNVGDLQTMLASGDVAVKTGAVTKDIAIDQPLSWTNTSRLTLDALQSVIVKKPVSVMGTGALTVTTNDNGNPKKAGGEFVIVPERGSIQFWDSSSSLIIRGHSYALITDINTLASDIAANPSGFYALARAYDASVDGTYSLSPITTQFSGIFEGLGNSFSNLSMSVNNGSYPFGLFLRVLATGKVRDLGILNADIRGGGGAFGFVTGDNDGTIERCRASGKAQVNVGSLGGLVGVNFGTVRASYVDVRLSGLIQFGGGLVGWNHDGTISSSYARGSITMRNSDFASLGGLVGDNEGAIQNSFTLARVKSGVQNDNSSFGGFVGTNEVSGRIESSYTAGEILIETGKRYLGGFVGFDGAPQGSLGATYWNLEKGVSDPSRGAGNVFNDHGIAGLTTAQFQLGLPDGFDPKIWGSDPNINGGYPYLLANPPQ